MSWEARMAERAAARRAAEPVEPHPYDLCAAAGHHWHLRGTSCYCSCGEFRGVTCVVLPPPGHDYEADSCDMCGARGVVRLRSN